MTEKPVAQLREDSEIAVRWLAVIEAAADMPVPVLKAAPPAAQLNQLLLHAGAEAAPEWLVIEMFRVWATIPAEQGLAEVAAALAALPKLRKALAIALLIANVSQRYHERHAALIGQAQSGPYRHGRKAQDARRAAALCSDSFVVEEDTDA